MDTQPPPPRVSHQLFVWNPPLNLTQKMKEYNLNPTKIPPTKITTSHSKAYQKLTNFLHRKKINRIISGWRFQPISKI